MTQRDDTVSLRQMYDHALEILELIADHSREDLDSDRVFFLAVTRLLEIVGEAANRVSGQSKSQTPQIPWGEVIGLRNRLIHGYDSINHDILWQVLSSDMAKLVTSLQTILNS